VIDLNVAFRQIALQRRHARCPFGLGGEPPFGFGLVMAEGGDLGVRRFVPLVAGRPRPAQEGHDHGRDDQSRNDGRRRRPRHLDVHRSSRRAR